MVGQIVDSLSPEELGGLPPLKKEDLLVDVSQAASGHDATSIVSYNIL
jgi:hypothetical protein